MGARKVRSGWDLFFDEFQSVDLELQGKLITFIENKSYRRVGSAESTKADVRFVFASNQRLFDLVGEGLVREDFAYRLERVMLELLPLRDRPFDIAPAIAFGLAKLHRQRTMHQADHRTYPRGISFAASPLLAGNLRQLENLLAKACERVELADERLITAEILSELLLTHEIEPLQSSHPLIRGLEKTIAGARNGSSLSLPSAVRELKSHSRRYALEEAEGDVIAASQLIEDDELCLRLENTKNLS